MPDISGYEVIRTIRGIETTFDSPIISLSAKTGSGQDKEAIAAGADATLCKPVDIYLMLERVQALLVTN